MDCSSFSSSSVRVKFRCCGAATLGRDIVSYDSGGTSDRLTEHWHIESRVNTCSLLQTES